MHGLTLNLWHGWESLWSLLRWEAPEPWDVRITEAEVLADLSYGRD